MREQLRYAQFDFTGKVALITGAGGGIGRAAALAFARAGANLMLVDIQPQACAESVRLVQAQQAQQANAGTAIFFACDVADSAQVAQMMSATLSQFGRLDYAFNNAGIEEESAPLAQGEEALFERIMRVNVKGTWLCMKAQIEQMLEQGGGSIVNTASVAGMVGAPLQAVYAASKHAVVGLTKSAAAEYGRAGIRINTVCPGVIRTAMLERAIEREPKREQWVKKAHPIGRLGEAEEIAQAALWLCSDSASFVTGHQLMVDGGLVAI